jgi:outer membrane protein assembly factor BamE (lipoprotein component of BamABCDE complex)
MMADSNTTAEGASAAVDPATLAKIETGKTTRQWVIAALGEPTSM